jgi:hypothetical protein
MKIAEVTVNEQAATPLSQEQARMNTMKQSIDRQKIALAQERERQQNAKYQKKIQKMTNSMSKKI